MLVAAPLYLVFRDLRGTLISVGTLLVTSLFLKKFWYDRLTEGEGRTGKGGAALASPMSAEPAGN